MAKIDRTAANLSEFGTASMHTHTTDNVDVNVSLDSRQYKRMVEACAYSCHQCRVGIGGFGKFGDIRLFPKRTSKF